MKIILVSIAVLLPSFASAQDPAVIQRHFEAGRFQQVVDTPASDAVPDVIFLAAQSYQKLGANDQALQTYDRLAQRPESDPWHFIGLSGRQLVEGQVDPSIASARQAVAIAPQEAIAHYQLGLALAPQQNWGAAAAAFEAAIERRPTFAYAHYYGGLMQYRANRPDRMAILFDQFLKLAPEAPERPEVLSIMRTLRGR